MNTILILIFIMFYTFQQNYVRERKQMVEKQIIRRGITDKAVIDAMLSVPRHLFVPEKLQEYAYDDTPLNIGEGQTISQPYIVAYMTEKLRLNKDDKVLEIGTGSGYQTAVLAKICDSVYSVEIIPELALTAKQNLEKAGISNVTVKCADGYEGWKEFAPFNAIIITAAPEYVPEPLLDQLASGGRLIIPEGKQQFIQNLMLYEKKEKIINSRTLMPVRFVPFIHKT
ncbi:MAG: protein-L-isoaspartate(D-aspartate) O-methyltransferase [Chlorobi bacterium]|nr:protein-L-isoaspartate(D-aspartate) O-methyltransferase [Chlorobiota bacterium]